MTARRPNNHAKQFPLRVTPELKDAADAAMVAL